MPILEFLIPRHPVSLQTRNRANLQAWKAYVAAEAAKVWQGAVIGSGSFDLVLVYLYDLSPPDTDNIVKSIQNALVGLVFSDDALISDVESHRRSLLAADRMPTPQLLKDDVIKWNRLLGEGATGLLHLLPESIDR